MGVINRPIEDREPRNCALDRNRRPFVASEILCFAKEHLISGSIKSPQAGSPRSTTLCQIRPSVQSGGFSSDPPSAQRIGSNCTSRVWSEC